MVESRVGRRESRKSRARREFGQAADAALDLLELVEMSWHDCYGQPSPDEQVVDDIFVVAAGSVTDLIQAARLAVEDFRDLRVQADALRR